MSKVIQLYAMHDHDRKARLDRGAFPIDSSQANVLNQAGYGIFYAVNEFEGSRQIRNLKSIRAWHCETDADQIDKPASLQKINLSPLKPTLIVESKNGYHIYFAAYKAHYDNYKTILKGLREHFNGDPKVMMVTILLRMPGYYHMKNPSNPFYIKQIEFNNVEYTEDEMLKAFPYVEPPKPQRQETTKLARPISLSSVIRDSDLTAFLNNLDHEEALLKLSGTQFVNFEQYSFDLLHTGKKNIVVNGKSTSCFIDENKKLGAVPGGPTVWQWLKYYGHSNKEIYRIIKQVFFN